VVGGLALVSCGKLTGTAANPAVASVSVAPSAQDLAVGQTLQLTVTLRDASGNLLMNRSLVWSTSDATIATVDATTGLVTAIAAGGPVTITATSEGQSGSAHVIAWATLSGVWIGTYSWTCGGGGTVPIQFTLAQAPASFILTGTVSHLGRSASVAGDRASQVTVDSHGHFTDPSTFSAAGVKVIVTWPASTGFVLNTFSGTVSGNTITGTSINGDGASASNAGCSEFVGPSGTFTINRSG
jgi:hypothetical protein